LKNGVSNLLTARGTGSAARGAGTIIAQDQQALEPKFIFSSKETLAAAPIPSFSIFNLQPSQFFQQHSNSPHQPSHNTTTFNNHHHHTHKSTTKNFFQNKSLPHHTHNHHHKINPSPPTPTKFHLHPPSNTTKLKLSNNPSPQKPKNFILSSPKSPHTKFHLPINYHLNSP
jgi:hypothetical protein